MAGAGRGLPLSSRAHADTLSAMGGRRADWAWWKLHETALSEIAEWKEKHRDLPIDLADASLLWVAE